MGEPSDEHRVIGLERSASRVREPNGQSIPVEQDGRLTTAAIAAKRMLASGSPPSDYRGAV